MVNSMENHTLSSSASSEDEREAFYTGKKRKRSKDFLTDGSTRKRAKPTTNHSISSDEESEEILRLNPKKQHSISDSGDEFDTTYRSVNGNCPHDATDNGATTDNDIHPGDGNTDTETESTLRYTLSYSPEYSPHFPVDYDSEKYFESADGETHSNSDSRENAIINGGENNKESISETKITSDLDHNRPSMLKAASITRDTNHIASVLSTRKEDNLQIIYEKLKQNREVPNRIEVVTNELVEEGFIDLTEDEKSQKDDDSLLQDVDSVLQMAQTINPNGTVDPNEVFELLETYSGRKDRVLLVVDAIFDKEKEDGVLIIEKEDESKKKLVESEVDDGFSDIMKDVKHIRETFPKVDPNEIFMLLEGRSNVKTRRQEVFEILKSRKPVESDHNAAVIPVPKDEHSIGVPKLEEQTAIDDPIYADMQILARMFPDKDKNEIYAYLEAHHQNPNRIQVVAEEFLRMQGGSQDDGSQDVTVLESESPKEMDKMAYKNKKASKAQVSSKANNDSAEVTMKESATNTSNDASMSQLEKEVEELKTIFPDCDPDYLVEALLKRENDPERSKNLAAHMLETRNFPRIKDVLEQRRKIARKNQLEKMRSNFDIKEFLQMFSDPLTYFYDEEKPVSEGYKNCALVQLMNDFPLMKDPYIKTVFEKHKCHFTPTVRELAEEAGAFRGRKKRSEKFLKRRRRQAPFPKEADELLIKETLFVQNEQDIKDYMEEQKKSREDKKAKARENNELYECGCCYDDEVLFEEMVSCADGHLFCQTCVRRSSEELIGQAKTKFPCLAGDCEFEFSTSILQTVLSPKTFSNLLRRLQEEEIQQADIPDLVSCPFCSFATIMSNPDDRVFKCLNPECLKESCRLCKEPNHIPLRCDEVERQGETSMRTFIENKITEAMLRTCWRCKKRFYKEEGCNKMTCTCGASMCYVCRKPVKDYSHFGTGEGQCPQDTDVFQLHKKEMEQAGKEAKEKFETEHPGAQLKFDPMKFVTDYKNKHNSGNTYDYDGDADGDDSDEYDEDDYYDDYEGDGYHDSDEDEDDNIYYPYW